MSKFWPESFGNELPTPPILMLRQAASELADRTTGAIEAQVTSGNDGVRQTHAFWLVAPALGNYRHRLLLVTHSISLYPCNVTYDPKGNVHQCEDSDRFGLLLLELLRDEETLTIVRALLSQSQALSA
jgi:hypothetical protein